MPIQTPTQIHLISGKLYEDIGSVTGRLMSGLLATVLLFGGGVVVGRRGFWQGFSERAFTEPGSPIGARPYPRLPNA